MSKQLLWIVPVALVAFWFWKRKSGGNGQPASAVNNTGTANKAPDNYFGGWDVKANQVLQTTTATVKAAQSSIDAITNSGLLNIFGIDTAAKGSASTVTTSGSGAGVPDGWFDEEYT